MVFSRRGRLRRPSWGASYTQRRAPSRPRMWYYAPERAWAVRSEYLNDDKAMTRFIFYVKHAYKGVWRNKSKCWLIPETSNIDGFKKLLEEVYGEFDFVPKMEIPLPPTESVVDHRGIFMSLVGISDMRNMSKGEARKLYILAVKRLHPDVNSGDGQQMASLNVAWREVEKELS